MTRRALPFLSLGLLLGSCSLLNAYDEVGGAGGGANTSSSTGTGPGSGGAGGGTGGGTSTSSSSGGGGGAAPTLSCARDGDVTPVHIPPGGTTSKIDAVRVFPLNGQTDRLVVVRSTGLQMYEVREAGNVITGAITTAMRFLDIRPSGTGISALAVTDSGGGQATLSIFRWLDTDPLSDPAIPTPLAELSNDDQKAVFQHRGPFADDVDVLLMGRDPDTMAYDVFFRRFGIDTPLQIQLVDDATPEVGEPRAFLQTGTTIHAFVGSPDANFGSTVRYSFAESDTVGGSPSSLGGDGTFLADLAPSGTGQFNVVIGEFADTTLLLRQGKLPNTELPNFKRDDIPEVHTFSSLDEVPMSNPPYLINDVMFAAGVTEVSGDVGAAWSMLLGKVGALSELNSIRLDEPDFLELQDDAHTGFGRSAHVGTKEPVSGVGGRLSIAWTERTVGGSDALYLARFNCTND